jgi:hypothetical protein
MDRQRFAEIRHHLGKTQQEMANLLGVSTRAIQSLEQGWRKIPVHVERQAYFVLAMKQLHRPKESLCWVVQKCPPQRRDGCPAWELKLGYICWFINGTVCHGRVQENWGKKMKLCEKCKVFRSILAPL